MQTLKFYYDTTTEKLSFTQTGLNLILSLFQILHSTRMISQLRHHQLTNLHKLIPTPRLMMTTTQRKTIYCPPSCRLHIWHLPLQLLSPRRKFLLDTVPASRPVCLPSHHLFYLTKHLLLCALARAHSPLCPHTLLLPGSTFSCRRLHLSRCLFLKGGRGWKLITQLMKALQLITSTQTILRLWYKSTKRRR